MTTKKRSVEKTIVTDFKVQVVDMNLRLKALTGAAATKVPEKANFHSADYTVTDTNVATLNGITSMVVVESFSPVILTIENETGSLSEIECRGLFIFYGVLSKVEVRSPTEEPVRISYIYS